MIAVSHANLCILGNTDIIQTRRATTNKIESPKQGLGLKQVLLGYIFQLNDNLEEIYVLRWRAIAANIKKAA